VIARDVGGEDALAIAHANANARNARRARRATSSVDLSSERVARSLARALARAKRELAHWRTRARRPTIATRERAIGVRFIVVVAIERERTVVTARCMASFIDALAFELARERRAHSFMSANSARYDRQIRLWGVEGQEKLSSCAVCAIACAPAIVEGMKSLVLGGCRAFAVARARARCAPSDLGEMFEITTRDVDEGTTKSSSIARSLREYNPQVTSREAIGGDASLRDEVEAYDVVVAGGLSDDACVDLERACGNGMKPFVIVRACGLFGEVRTGGKERWATENVSAVGSNASDLRLMTPWPELVSYGEMKTCDLERLDSAAFKHVPFAALLLRASAMASASRDRRAVKDALAAMRRGNDEENFDEAMANVRYTWTDTGAVPKEVDDITRDARARALSLESDRFWFLAAALRAFIDRESCLPLEGSIPDMTSTTEAYIELQKLYADKAAKDAAAVWQRAVELAQEVGFLQPEEFITERDAKMFCKNSRNIRFMTWGALEDELYPKPGSAMAMSLDADAKDPSKKMAVSIFAAFRAADVFERKYGRRPGAFDVSTLGSEQDEQALVHRDGEELAALTSEWLARCGVEQPDCAVDVAHEFARYGDGQLHAVGAILGGIASQELIKIITQQYTPMTKRLIYDGVHSTMTYLG